MKRIFMVILASVLCLSIVPAFADSNVTINVDSGNCSPVNINVNSIDGCNNYAVIGAPVATTGSCQPGKTPGCIVIDGVPGCIEPPNYCGPVNTCVTTCLTPCQRQQMYDLKTEGRDLFRKFVSLLEKKGINVQEKGGQWAKTNSWRIKFRAKDTETKASDRTRWFICYIDGEGNLYIIITSQYCCGKKLSKYPTRALITPLEVSEVKDVADYYLSFFNAEVLGY